MFNRNKDSKEDLTPILHPDGPRMKIFHEKVEKVAKKVTKGVNTDKELKP